MQCLFIWIIYLYLVVYIYVYNLFRIQSNKWLENVNELNNCVFNMLCRIHVLFIDTTVTVTGLYWNLKIFMLFKHKFKANSFHESSDSERQHFIYIAKLLFQNYTLIYIYICNSSTYLIDGDIPRNLYQILMYMYIWLIYHINLVYK